MWKTLIYVSPPELVFSMTLHRSIWSPDILNIQALAWFGFRLQTRGLIERITPNPLEINFLNLSSWLTYYIAIERQRSMNGSISHLLTHNGIQGVCCSIQPEL